MFMYDHVWMCVCACIYLHTDEKLYLKLLENKSNSDQNAFQAHYLEIYFKTWVCSWGHFFAYANKLVTIMNGGYSTALLKKKKLFFVFERETIYSRILGPFINIFTLTTNRWRYDSTIYFYKIYLN